MAALNRDQLFARDDYRCVYCGELWPAGELTVDHVQPRVRGGDRSGGNLVTACKACNTLKGHRRLSHFLADHPDARANFFQLARHVWPRHLRTVERELLELGRQAAPRR
ncbi:MAG: HNH endonuclease [Gemmatimonadota bacterium]|nr:HNH endonuclease [Gemmatimonadota bacterium]